ncbi:MAG: N-acetylneuraminate synthase family protein [Candidatus Sungbacteria bacterium]|nr:N-acetylneuraminate synthase family protein [Candidatus Sungbacteria bacterium]
MPQAIFIGGKPVGDGHPCFIVAEIGVNHNGDAELAKKLIASAAECGADAVKSQKRTVEDILIRSALEKPYDSPTALAPTYGEHRNKLELGEDAWEALRDFAADRNVIFFASVWDKKSADFLELLGAPAYKIASADLTNLPLLEHIAEKKKPIIMSTGMSTLEEIDEAVETILPRNKDLILMHTVSDYPCAEDKVNLRMIGVLKNRYGLPVGYSGHETGIAIAVAARALGAAVIEKHFTLDRAMPGPDHASSLEPEGPRREVKYIRVAIDPAMGDGLKRITENELKARAKLAKSVAAKEFIPRGAAIAEHMLAVKGPGTGLKPKYLKTLVGKTAQIDILEDTLIPKEALEW